MNLENTQLQTICRTCLAEKNEMKNIFDIADIIRSCAPIQLEQDDGLPTTICLDCSVLARKAYQFRLLCQNSDSSLRKRLCKHETEKYDLDSAEVCTDLKCFTYDNSSILQYPNQTNDSLSKINTTHKTYKTESLEDYENQTFEAHKTDSNENQGNETIICKTEIFEVCDDNNKDFQEYNNGKLTANHSSSSATQIVQSQDNESGHQVAINNVKRKRYGSNKKKKKQIASDASNNEKPGNKTKQELTCEFCTQEFRYKESFQTHIQKHINGLKCSICDKVLQTPHRLRIHRNMHKRKGVHVCPTCGKKYTFPENLKVHQRVYAGIKPYNCRFCNKTFTQMNERRSHEVVHTTEKAYLCSICGSKFSRSQSLLNHTKRVHSKERPHACTVCNKKFIVRPDLDKHMNCHSEKRNFVCKVCNKTFKHRANLNLHEKIHTGIKPHVCPICQRAFLQKHVLTSHLLTHAP